MNLIRQQLLCVCLLTIVMTVTSSISGAVKGEPFDSVKPFLKKYCIECHGAEVQENSKRFDNLKSDLDDLETLQLWQGVVDQLNLGDMPPKDSLQPSDQEIADVVKHLTVPLQDAYASLKSTNGQTVTRRLNRFELRNTVRDLLYINDPELRIGNKPRLIDNNGNGRVENTSTDPFRAFPGDETEEGFDNIGNRLVMSDFLLRLMFDAAEESLALATYTGKRPEIPVRDYKGVLLRTHRKDLPRLAGEIDPNVDTLFFREMVTPDELRGGMKSSAKYRLTVQLSAHNQQHDWGEILPTDQTQPMLVHLRLFKRGTRNDNISLERVSLPGNGQMKTLSIETWIDKDWLPQIIWENGPTDREARADLLARTYLPDVYRDPPDRKVITDKQEFDKVQKAWLLAMHEGVVRNYRGPTVQIHSFQIEPVLDQWPPKSHRELYGTEEFGNAEIEELLLRFAERAFRRPVTKEEVQPYVDLVMAKLQTGPELPEGGLQDLEFSVYDGKWTKLPQFDELKPVKSGPLVEGLVDIRVAEKNEHYGVVFEGLLEVKQSAQYEFKLASDDGARILVDGQRVIDHDGLHGASTKTGTTTLAKGLRKIRVEYFAYGQPNSLQVFWSGPGFVDAPLAVGTQSNAPVVVDEDTLAGIKAIQMGYTAILCSPDFLYLKEQKAQLTDYEIANRLSYFLWSSMPDEALLELARTKKLHNHRVLQTQVDRMLADPRSKAFVHHFTERWLRLDKISESPPELNGPFRVYWDRRMEPQVIAQTNEYFGDLLYQNGPIRLLVESDYTFMNEQIASVFYNRSDVKGDYLRRVATNDPRRGGVLTMPSVMTSTANGVDTSPVVRGVWVLENILGTPPAAPPPDVEPLSPDLSEAKTIREQLEIHREQTTCNSCHRKIDPLGFAFENFDPIGRWRDRYRTGEIDPSTTLANGTEVNDIVALKTILVENESQVVRGLTRKLLAYSSGRVLEPLDRGEVEKIVTALEKSGNHLKDLIKQIVISEVFLSK